MEKPVEYIAQVWFWPIHPHKLPSNLQGSGGLFCEPGSSVLSKDFQLDSSLVIDWAILAALFSFSSTSWVLPWLCAWDRCLAERSTLFSSSAAWQMTADSDQECLNTFLQSLFLQWYEVYQYHMLKNSPTPWCSHLQTWLLVWCFGGDVRCHFSSKHVVSYDIRRVQFWSHLTRVCSPRMSWVYPNVVSQTPNELQHASSSKMESCVVCVHGGHGGWVHYLL